jgi:hypothetical protein
MADEDYQNVRMPMGDWDHVAEDSDNDDDIRRGENENMDDLGEDESDEDESDNNSDDDEVEDKEEEEEVNNEIVEKFIRTFHNCEYDKEFDALCLDRAVDRRPTAATRTQPTQASYNKPDNWRERNGIGLTKVKQQLQDCIDRLSYDNCFYLDLTHNSSGYQLSINEEPIVWHEPILDEYWNQLEAEIDRKKQQEIVTKIEHIKIENVEMKKECIALLVHIIVSGRATNSSGCVHFMNTNLCGEGIDVYLSKLVNVSAELCMLDLAHYWIDNMLSACCISRSLNLHACITWLQLGHCDLGSSPEMLSVILQSEVKNIFLGSNNIDSLGVVKIAQYLEGDPPMQHINLDSNRLNDNDIILILQALKRNTHLRHWTSRGII